MTHFIDCNSRQQFDEFGGSYEMSEETYSTAMQEAAESGLTPDYENGVFVMEGYGALVGFCPENVETLDQLFHYNQNDFKRATPQQPTAMEEIKRMLRGEESDKFWSSPYYGYGEYAEKDGYDLVIGPGCTINGEQWKKAVYCKNYLEILEREKESPKAKTK